MTDKDAPKGKESSKESKESEDYTAGTEARNAEVREALKESVGREPGKPDK